MRRQLLSKRHEVAFMRKPPGKRPPAGTEH
jgi:hypothetical protein